MSAPNLLSRYNDGQRDQVWQELRQLGNKVRESRVFDEAQLVCDEMARRARHNIETIVGRLREAGYRFHGNDDDESPETPFFPATAGANDQADWLLERFGAVPMTLLSWVRLVGDVWLVGTHPQWPSSGSADPLVLEAEGSRYADASIRTYFEDELENWHRWTSQDAEAGLLSCPSPPIDFTRTT